MSASSAQRKPKNRILVVDDHPLLREGVSALINRQDDLACCGEARNADEAHSEVLRLKPDLMLLDLRLGNGDGIECIKSLKAQVPTLRILILSQFDETLYAERALRAGALGYIMKEYATEEVLSAIRAVLAGEYYVSRKIAVLVLHKLVATKHEVSGDETANFTDREMHVFQLLGAGLSTKQIADELHLSVKTVETYREHLKHKLRLKNSAELISAATHWAAKPAHEPVTILPKAVQLPLVPEASP